MGEESRSRRELMIEHNQVNYFLIPLYLLVLSNHTIGLIQVVIQVKLPVHQYVILLYSSYFVSSYFDLHVLHLGLEENGSRNRTDYQKFVPSTTHEIPITFLARQDPVLDQILYYADVPLFEDELHDNGESILNARIVSPVHQALYVFKPISPSASFTFLTLSPFHLSQSCISHPSVGSE
jgi:hypothetical protein